MAEQAIETIYALGKYPDVLCNDFVKNLTRRAFGSQPTTLAEREQEQGEKEPDEHASYWLEGDRSRNRYLLPSTRRRRLLADHHKSPYIPAIVCVVHQYHPLAKYWLINAAIFVT